MKIYISGKISGLNYEDVQFKFNEAQEFLESLGFDVVNPLNNGLDKSEPWNVHIVKDIELLLSCDAIYLIGNWIESKGSRCEYHIAEETGRFILYEAEKGEILPFTRLLGDDKHKAWRAYTATCQVTKLRLHEYSNKVRTTKEFFTRLILIHNLHTQGISVEVISLFVNRSVGAIYHCIKKYKDEYKFNQKFRNMADKVTEILKVI